MSSEKAHPAKYNLKFIGVFAELLSGCKTVLDPFGGVGRIRLLEPYGFDTVNIEIEPEWATCICGDSTNLPIKSNSVDAICTSPTYGNRMADSFTDHQPEKAYVRNTYRHKLGRKPSAGNTGIYYFGNQYLILHEMIYVECNRVLKPGGKFILNTKNFVHTNIETDVTGSHITILNNLGFSVKEKIDIPVPGLTYGANRQRVDFESITLLVSEKK